MAADPILPKFLSLEFHTRFFPRVLRDRLCRKGKESEGTTFTSTMEMMILLAVCLMLAVIGIPSAVTRGSILGCILSVFGIGGTAALLISSVGSQWGTRPTYDSFLVGMFFFDLSLGILVGISIGMSYHSLLLGACASLAGLVAGYALGIFSGLWAQRLGWMAMAINALAGLAAIIVGIATIILLFALALK
jgi:hypothetical protein